MKCLIDTGSKVSLLRHSVLDEAMPDWNQKCRRVEQKANLVGITGDTLETVACCEVPGSLGDGHFTARLFIGTEKVMLRVAGLIGQNILSEQGIDLWQSKRTLSLGGVEIPLLNCTGKVDRTQNPRDWLTTERTTIRLPEEGILPPLSECVLEGQVACEPAYGRLRVAETCLVDVSGLAGAYSLGRYSEDGRQPVRIVKTTLKEVKLPRDKAVGVLVFAVVTEQPVEEAVGRLISTADLCNKFDLSHVSDPDKSRIRDLIFEFSSAFSTVNTDTGHFEVIKHQIPTNDAAPVYRRAYRIP